MDAVEEGAKLEVDADGGCEDPEGDGAGADGSGGGGDALAEGNDADTEGVDRVGATLCVVGRACAGGCRTAGDKPVGPRAVWSVDGTGIAEGGAAGYGA